MAQLNDSMATQIMGELDGLTNKIDTLNEEIVKNIKALPGAADKEMKRAGEAAITALSGQVAGIASKIAGDAAATERNSAFQKAVIAAGAGALFCAILFSGGGFLLGKSLSSSRVTSAERDLEFTTVELASEKKRVGEAVADLEKKSVAEIAKIRAASGWAGTPTGQLAKRFFEVGTGATAALCKGKSWEIKTDPNDKNVKWCIPKRRDLIGGDDELNYGWKIP